MPFALVIIGLTLVVTGAKNTYAPLGTQLVKDFTGPANFTYWLVAIGAIGSVGYIPALRDLTRYFMALVIIAMFLSNKGFFQKFSDALKAGPGKSASAGSTTTANNANPLGSGQVSLSEGASALTAISALL